MQIRIAMFEDDYYDLDFFISICIDSLEQCGLYEGLIE